MMLGAGKNSKILRAVVATVAIEMMHLLVLGKWTAKHLLGNSPVSLGGGGLALRPNPAEWVALAVQIRQVRGFMPGGMPWYITHLNVHLAHPAVSASGAAKVLFSQSRGCFVGRRSAPVTGNREAGAAVCAAARTGAKAIAAAG